MTRPSDTFIVDAIATYLGTWKSWNGADACDVIADLIGMVRPHPGSEPSEIYAQTFRNSTGREIVNTYNMGWQ